MSLPRLVLAILIGASTGCTTSEDVAPTRATVVFLDMTPQPPSIQVTKAAELRQLESFFPDYRSRPSSMTAAGWIAGHQVLFDFPDGTTIQVTVSGNDKGKTWSVGQGDFSTRGDFKGFADGLLARNTEKE